MSTILPKCKNSWNFTPMGRINFTTDTELRDFLKAGKGQISVTLSQSETVSISPVNSTTKASGKAFRLDGTLAKTDVKGIVIQDGMKILKR